MSAKIVLAFSVAGCIGWDDDKVADIYSLLIGANEHILVEQQFIQITIFIVVHKSLQVQNWEHISTH